MQVGDQDAVRPLLDAEVLEGRDAGRAGDAAGGVADQAGVDTGARGGGVDVDLAERLQDGVRPGRVVGQELGVVEALLDDRAEQRRQRPGVAARPHAQVEVGHRGGLGDDRVEHDDRPLGVLLHVAQDGAGAREALRLPRVLADEQRHLGVGEVAARVAAVELRVDPELAGLLLRERAGAVARAERAQRRGAVGAAEVVPLAAAAVVEDRLAAVLVADGGEALGQLGDRGVPVDLLEAAVGHPLERRLQAVAAVLVAVEAHRLVARVAVRLDVLAIAADALEGAPVDVDLDAAVALAEDAGGFLPGGLYDVCHSSGTLVMMRVIVKPAPARERMIESAAALFSERGVDATAFSDVLEHSGAPRGSIYHHFPDGKAQLAEEATRYAGEFIARRSGAGAGVGRPAWRQSRASRRRGGGRSSAATTVPAARSSRRRSRATGCRLPPRSPARLSPTGAG